MNNICIIGRLCAQPEIKTTTSGVSVCSVNVAVDRDYKANGEKATDFIDSIVDQLKSNQDKLEALLKDKQDGIEKLENFISEILEAKKMLDSVGE